MFKIPAVIAIGKAHGKSAAQVALRWLVQQNISAVTAAHNPDYIAEDSKSPAQATAISWRQDTFFFSLFSALLFSSQTPKRDDAALHKKRAAAAFLVSKSDKSLRMCCVCVAVDIFDFELTEAEMATLAAI